MRRRNSLPVISMVAILILSNVVTITLAPYSKQTFVVNQNEKVFLDINSEKSYNGTVKVTVLTGTVNATLNSQRREIAAGASYTFTIVNTTTIYFAISSNGYAEGYFELELNLAVNDSGRNPINITIGILAAFLIALSVATYYIRAKRMEPKPGEEKEEFLDPETLRRRKEAAGAEKRYLGLDDEI